MADTAALPATEAGPAPKLDDLMLAMDVVDTLRHQEGLIEKELSQEDRDHALKDRLRTLYEGQGLTVSDRILDEGIQALKESRFSYTPPVPSFAVTLAKAWMHRRRVGAGIAVFLIAAAAGWGYLTWSEGAAERAATEARIELAETLPRSLEAASAATLAEAKDDAALKAAEALVADGRAALARGDAVKARAAVTGLDQLRERLVREYDLKIISRPGERTGVYRIPDVNEGTRNYYLIVEAVTGNGELLSLPVTSEEDGKTSIVDKWAVRVPKATYDRVGADKQDDGIVEDNVLAQKPRGALDPVYLMPVEGGAITSW